MRIKGNYLYHPLFDYLFILGVPFWALIIIILLPSSYKSNDHLPDIAWLILVVFIDVAHVYTTLYRTYFDKQAVRNNRMFFIITPILCYVFSVLAYAIGEGFFWRCLAYLAVFHFIRQQYGFMRLYSHQHPTHKYFQWIDTITIYTFTLFPIIYWHLTGPKKFNWFIEGDFFYFQFPALLPVFWVFYLCILTVFIFKELYLALHKQLNISKFILIAGTGLSWYVGIVMYNGDLVFTLLNVVAHGIPYMALVWIWGYKKMNAADKSSKTTLFKPSAIWIFLGIVLSLAFVEEWLWDSLVWLEHKSIFSFFDISLGYLAQQSMPFLVPLLALPQLLHYVIDGFIWKMKTDKFNWKQFVIR